MTTSQNLPTSDALADILRSTLDAYFEEVDPEEADTDDMAWTLVRAIERAAR